MIKFNSCHSSLVLQGMAIYLGFANKIIKIMKKTFYLSLLLALTFCISLPSCSGNFEVTKNIKSHMAEERIDQSQRGSSLVTDELDQ